MLVQNKPEENHITFNPSTVDLFIKERKQLLEELEAAYQNMEMILQQTAKEKKIAYNELQEKFSALEQLYSELSNRENMMIHMEKLSSIGQFISEILHELGNPLTAIVGSAEIAKMKNPPAEISKFLESISSNAKRMSNYMERFREMVYKGEENFCMFDVNQNLIDAVDTIEILKPKGLTLSTNLYPEPLRVKGDPYQISQIYLNLAKNAFDAMQNHGNTLKFTTKYIDSDWLQNSGEFGDTYCQIEKAWQKILRRYEVFALIEIADNGSGIPSDKLQQIFESFFTTKERGKGTGLGLSIASDIIKRHNGNIAVKSKVKKGTTFQLLFPLTDDKAETDDKRCL